MSHFIDAVRTVVRQFERNQRTEEYTTGATVNQVEAHAHNTIGYEYPSIRK